MEARMIDFAKARRLMVDGQIRTVDVTDHAVIAAFLAVPRERFLPVALRYLAYSDGDVPLGRGHGGPRALPAAATLARLAQLAGIGPEDVVLDVRSGAGYFAAVLARLSPLVVALEDDAALSAAAGDTLAALGVDNVATVIGPPAAGYASEGPYDVILVEGAVDRVPAALLDQLKDGGRLVAVVGADGAAQAMLFTRSGSDVTGRPAFNATLPPLLAPRPLAFTF